MENENRNKTDWLKDLANDESLWEPRAYTEMPAVIAYEYRRLHSIAVEGNVYGTMLQMKDVCEVILKYPMMLGLCILKEDKKPDDVEFYREVISLIFSDVPMSLGKWVDKVRRLKKRQLPKILFQILDRTLELFSQEIGGYADIPNWRNLTIGHGVLRSEDDIGLQTEMKTLLLLLKSYFNGGILDEYTHIVLTQGTTPLIGESATKLQSNEPFVLRINQNGQKSASIGALEYIFPSDHKIYFFDSYRKPKTTFLDYVEGIPLFVKHGFFYDFYEELKKSDMILKKTAEMVKSSDTYLTKVTNKLMDELDKPPIFEPPLYIYNWFSDQIRQNINGCFILKLGRGLGKSALASNMSTNHIDASCVVRTYHCFRTQIRTADDFLTKIKRIFLDTGKSSDEIEDIQGLHEYTDIKRQDWDAKATANLLNFLADFYQKEKGIKKLVLVIDGIDEIIDHKLFDLFPKQGDLAEGVYVLYTSRPATEKEIADASLRERIQSMDIDEDKICSENNEEHQKVVLSYAQKEMQDTYHKDADSTEYIELADKAGYNFLKLRVLIPVYCSTNTMDIASLPEGAAMFKAFLSFLEDNYGKKFFNNRVLPVLITLSIFYDGLSFDDLAHLLEDRENRLLLAAAINDLKGVLSVERSAKGNVYKLANEEYVQYINEEYGSNILSYQKKYADDFSVMVAKIQDTFDRLSIKDTNCLLRYNNRRIRNYITKKFPAIFVLREYLFQIIGTPRSFSTNSFGIFGNEAEMVGFMEQYLLLNKCIGYSYAEMNRSVEIFDWMQLFLIDLAGDAIGRKKIYDIGEKLAVCFSYLYQIMYFFQRENDIHQFWKIAENFYKVLCEIYVFKNSYHWFKLMNYLGYKGIGNYWKTFNQKYMQHVINNNEFRLFVENENEVYSLLDISELNSFDNLLSQIPHTEKERAWINNLLLNKYINDSYGLPNYTQIKKSYDTIIVGGCFPTYFEHDDSKDNTEKETEKFHAVITVLKNNDRKKYRELDSGKSLYNLDWKSLCEELGINSLERYEEAVYYYLEGHKRRKEELERFIEEETVIDDITSYDGVISFYYATAFPDTTVDINHVENSKEFFSWLTRTYSVETINDYLQRRSISERVANILSYRYRTGRKENIERVKKWLDEYQEIYSILDSEQYCWVYFSEFESYFDYMIDTDQEKLYLDLRNNKLWVKIWKQITPHYNQLKENGPVRFTLAQSLIYLVFTIKYAMKRGDFLIAHKISAQYIKDICKYGYFDLGMRLYAWVECQKALRTVGDSSVDCYEPIHRLEKQYELMKDNPELAHKYYINILGLRLNESICAFMFGDYEKIPTLEDKIKVLVMEAKKETDRTHWQYIDESQIKSISFQISVLNLIYKYVSGAILGDQFACEARTMIPDLRERFALDSEYWDMELKYHYIKQGVDAAESFLFSMFSCICKESFSNKEYNQLCSKFDEYWHSFSFSNEGFSMNFSFDRNDWYFML